MYSCSSVLGFGRRQRGFWGSPVSRRRAPGRERPWPAFGRPGARQIVLRREELLLRSYTVEAVHKIVSTIKVTISTKNHPPSVINSQGEFAFPTVIYPFSLAMCVRHTGKRGRWFLLILKRFPI
jgi:hypothetical protein